MNKLSKCAEIRKLILEFWQEAAPEFKTWQLLKYIQDKIGTNYIMPDTILRQMRHLKQDGLINYECFNTKLMIYKKIKIL